MPLKYYKLTRTDKWIVMARFNTQQVPIETEWWYS